jgi:hypothetical protein
VAILAQPGFPHPDDVERSRRAGVRTALLRSIWMIAITLVVAFP